MATNQTQPLPPQSPALQVFKIFVLGFAALVLAAAVVFCVLEVGHLNEHAAVLQACRDTSNHAGCPAAPVTADQIESVRSTADTLGDVGWIAALMLILSVGGSLMEVLKRKR